jgi:hypothetical protein
MEETQANNDETASPLLDDVKVRYNTVHFNGSFMKETIYRSRPSPEVDAAWEDLGANCVFTQAHASSNTIPDRMKSIVEGFIVSEEDGVRFGLDPGMVKRLPRQGGGYVAMSEGMHHLHCVNLLRQASYFNYEYYRRLGEGAFKNDDDVIETHIGTLSTKFKLSYGKVKANMPSGHCVDILRQQLMCTFDTSIFGQWWVEGVGPFVDFNTKHRCKNFDALSGWVRDHQLSISGGDLVEFRVGDKRLTEIP